MPFSMWVTRNWGPRLWRAWCRKAINRFAWWPHPPANSPQPSCSRARALPPTPTALNLSSSQALTQTAPGVTSAPLPKKLLWAAAQGMGGFSRQRHCAWLRSAGSRPQVLSRVPISTLSSMMRRSSWAGRSRWCTPFPAGPRRRAHSWLARPSPGLRTQLLRCCNTSTVCPNLMILSHNREPQIPLRSPKIIPTCGGARDRRDRWTAELF